MTITEFLNYINNNSYVSLDDTTEEELESIIKHCYSNTCCLDFTQTGLLERHVAAHLPCLISLVNASLQQGSFHRALKTANEFLF